MAVNSRIARDRNGRNKNVNANSASAKKELAPNKVAAGNTVVAGNTPNHKVSSKQAVGGDSHRFFTCRRQLVLLAPRWRRRSTSSRKDAQKPIPLRLCLEGSL